MREQCCGNLEQGTEPTKDSHRAWEELVTHPQVNPAFAHMCSLPVTPKGINKDYKKDDMHPTCVSRLFLVRFIVFAV